MGLIADLKTSGFVFKKSLGQNFILDQGFLRGIVEELGIETIDTVVEIGTGAGTLTRVLAQKAGRVISYEIDRRLMGILEKQLAGLDNVQVVFEDALKADILFDGQGCGSELLRRDAPYNDVFVVVANIPYYITTPLIIKFLNDPHCTRICVLVQDDVARRIVAKPGGKDYGALSVTCQVYGKCKIIKLVPREMFIPKPNVDSAFVVIDKYNPEQNQQPQHRHNPNQKFLDTLETTLKGLFAARRKTILNGLSHLLDIDKASAREILAQAGIDENMRPEQITPQQFVKLAQKCKL